MVFASTSVKSTLLTVAMLAVHVHGHANMMVPLPTWPDGYYNWNSFSGTIDGYATLTVPDGMSYDTSPDANLLAFETAFNASSYTSLKDLVLANEVLQSGASHECGFSLTTGTARDLPEQVEWTEFTSTHYGPCEVWCDDVLAYADHNCAVDHAGSTGYLPYDVSKCQGASMLTSRWLALHVSTWQVYTNCAPLTGSTAASSGSAASSSSASTTTATPTTTTEASAAESDAESAADDYDNDETEAPATTTAAPATTTEAPATTTTAPAPAATSSCRRRMRN